jgi:multidrug efflux system outer membrane protein
MGIIMSKRLLSVLPLVIGLAGCSFVPEYFRPKAPVPDTWPAESETRVGAGGTAVAPTSQNWREVFLDPTLQGLIAKALDHNRDLRVATARVEEARALAGIARADRFPQVDLVTQRSASLTPGDLTTTGRSLNSQRYDANLGVTAFELDFWGRVASLDAAARAGFLASDYAQRAFRFSLIADVASAYFAHIELQERLALATITEQSRVESRRLIVARRDVGLANDLDVHSAEGAYQTARAERANLARQSAAAYNALQLLVGDTPDLAQSTAPTKQGFLASSWLAELSPGLPSEVLLSRPDVMAAEQKLVAANANIGAARAAFLPKIALTATAGTASKALAGLFKAGSGAWAFTPVLRYPLFDAGRTADAVDLATARKDIAVAEYEKVIQQAFRETADLLAARDYLVDQLQAVESNATAQGDRLHIVSARHEAGVSSYLELLDAQREHFSAQQSVLAVRRQQLSVLASLFKALGRT